MTSENRCPSCEGELVWASGHYYCEPCQQAYKREADCPDCGQMLEKLQACGSASYFCNHCNELKSKSRAKRYWVALTN
ncbi:zinc ribbon domain-containing protein [Thaumasiovibrio subtropicus]|uniref:zinc ribbon domain-containing protein n=1 Tax=Thaumasiovibrio subtropicus TaxID=1891207 RepID=UPI000B351917|nr:zinc ribbon domain-containing protein [Thaumasiovibrio subtropicus]